MVMDQFVTTYRNDYLWPCAKSLQLRPQLETLCCTCDCHNRGDPGATRLQQMNAFLGSQAQENESWSRLGPMGPLLDPKIYPVKESATPEPEIDRFKEPNVFLLELQEKYPFIYECLRNDPQNDLLARINRDRLRTTYQVDYCKKKEIPYGTPMQMIRGARNDVAPPCPKNLLKCGRPCVPMPNNKALRISTITKQFVESGMPARSEPKTGPCGCGIESWNPFDKESKACPEVSLKQTNSASLDIVDTWGQMIYRESVRRHHRLR